VTPLIQILPIVHFLFATESLFCHHNGIKLFRIAGISELIRIYAGWIRKSPVFSIQIIESNHNVSVWLKKTPGMPNPFQLESGPFVFHLLHPVDPSRNKRVSLNDAEGDENFITSRQLDEYCHSGKYYISC
jgi:hypothetical protein